MVAANDTIQLSVMGRVTGQEHVHTLHLRSNTGGQSLQGAIDTWQAGCAATYRAMFMAGSDTPYEVVESRHVCGAGVLDAPAVEGIASGSQAGTRTFSGDGEPMPPFIACVATIRTGLAGRSYRGRNFFGGLFESDVAASTVLDAHRTRITNYLNAVMAVFGPGGTSADWSWVVFSRKLRAGGMTCAQASNGVTSFIVRTEVSTQRSRKLGRGR